MSEKLEEITVLFYNKNEDNKEKFSLRVIGKAKLYKEEEKNKLILKAFSKAASGEDCTWKKSDSLAGGYFFDSNGDCYGFKREFEEIFR